MLMNRRCERRVHKQRRFGVSLVEVLISIGVLSIGLLGVISLLPLASHQAQQGVLEDRKASVGRRAFREFLVRGMSNPNHWVAPPGMPPSQFMTVDRMPLRRAYCIDPIGYAPGPSATPAFQFPFNRTGNFQPMLRLSLSSQPGLGTIAMADQGVPLPMSFLQARQSFTVEDDLNFEVPDDEVLPPFQNYLDDDPNNPSDQGTKRTAEGRFSWFATLVPEIRSAPGGIASQTDLYRLSIVVTAGRVPAIDTQLERSVLVAFPGLNTNHRVAYAGGDIRVKVAEPLDLTSGQWLLLTQVLAPQANPPITDFRWYEILFVDRENGDITLQGADWAIVDATGTPRETWATIVPNVTAVYEKTVRLETSSSWTTY